MLYLLHFTQIAKLLLVRATSNQPAYRVLDSTDVKIISIADALFLS